MIKRRKGWPEILNAELIRLHKVPFEFGKHDCCVFSANMVKALTDPEWDPMEGLRGYRSVAGSVRMLKDNNAKNIDELISRIMEEHNIPEVPVALAKRGDVVLGEDEKGEPSAGICCGMLSVYPGENNLIYKYTVNARKAWHYG